MKIEQDGFHGFVVKGPPGSKFEDLPGLAPFLPHLHTGGRQESGPIGPVFPRYKTVEVEHCVTHTEPEMRRKVVMKWTASEYMGRITFK